MSYRRSILTTSAAGLTVAALVSVGTMTTAQADPDPATPFRNYAAVGSDTIQDVWNGLSNGGTVAGVGSYNAFGSTTIQTKTAGATFNRPAGSGAGVRALSAVWDPSYTSHDYAGTALTNGEVDFARSSSGPTAGSGLTYLPFARDAVSVAQKPYSGSTAAVKYTTAQLAAIYGGPDDNTAGTNVTYDASTGLPKFGGKILHPSLPQASSGTRSFFLSAIGVPTANLASYVEPSPSTLPENDGTALTDQGQLIPFSVAQWIAQRNQVSTDTTAGVKIGTINDKAPTSGSAPSLIPGPLYGAKNPQGSYSSVPVAGVGTFNRDTYNVIPTAFLTGTTFQLNLVKKLTGKQSGQLGSTAAKNVVKSYGFGNLAYLGDSSFYRSGTFLH